MNNFTILKEIFYAKEVTIDNDGSAYLEKYFNCIELDEKIINKLIYHNILIEDSGDFESGETHYVLADNIEKYTLLENIIFENLLITLRQVRLNKLV